jgi:hypothetical protein
MKTKFNPWSKNLQYVVDNISDLTTISNVVLTAVNGDGYFQVKNQTTDPTAPISGDGFKLYADSSGILTWKGENGYTVKFNSSSNTNDRTYILPDGQGTFLIKEGLIAFPKHF